MKIKKYLLRSSRDFRGFMLKDSVYIILLNEAINTYADQIEPFAIDEKDYFCVAKKRLRAIWWENRIEALKRKMKKYPRFYSLLRMAKKYLAKAKVDR